MTDDREPDGKRRVWMIIAGFHPLIGGTERQAQEVAERLTSLGWSVNVLTRRHRRGVEGSLTRSESVAGIPVARVYSRGRGRIGSLMFLLSGIWHLGRHGRSGIYHAHDTGTAAWIAILASYLFRGRSIVKLRTGRLGYERRDASVVTRWNLRLIFRLVHRLLVVNRDVERYLSQLGVPADQFTYLPNGIDTNHFTVPSPEQKADARRCVGLSHDAAVVLWLGRIEHVKGVDVLVSAWALLPERLRSAGRLVLVGEGSATDAIRALALRLGLESSVIFAGSTVDARRSYWCADLFVLPSRSEGMSNALLEAMASGLPVVASEVGGAPDIVDPGQNGLLFASENPEDLADKLVRIFEIRQRWRGMGAQARASVLRHGDMHKTLELLEGTYLEVG